MEIAGLVLVFVMGMLVGMAWGGRVGRDIGYMEGHERATKDFLNKTPL